MNEEPMKGATNTRSHSRNNAANADRSATTALPHGNHTSNSYKQHAMRLCGYVDLIGLRPLPSNNVANMKQQMQKTEQVPQG